MNLLKNEHSNFLIQKNVLQNRKKIYLNVSLMILYFILIVFSIFVV